MKYKCGDVVNVIGQSVKLTVLDYNTEDGHSMVLVMWFNKNHESQSMRIREGVLIKCKI
jgi:uncharacterized protein YodC (DUF2158 family)